LHIFRRCKMNKNIEKRFIETFIVKKQKGQAAF